MCNRIRAKKHRLKDSDYYGEIAVSCTLCVEHRKPLFTSKEVVDVFVTALTEEVRAAYCVVPAYCFMPDHCHLLVRGVCVQSRAMHAVSSFKQKTGFWLKENMPSFEWQESFYDRKLRKSDDFRIKARYIFDNPYRAGICTVKDGYPFSGWIDGAP